MSDADIETVASLNNEDLEIIENRDELSLLESAVVADIILESEERD